jgi:hypothetical protein
MVSPPADCECHESDVEILGLEPHEADPVRIILAAQLRLRRCRLGQVAGSRGTAMEVRRIIAARDTLLRRTVGTLTRLSVGSITSGRTIAPGGAAVATAVRDFGRP